MDINRFPFRFTTAHRLAALPWGITPATTCLLLGPDHLEVRFGPWKVHTERANIAGATLSGPYDFHRSAGPARLSLTDRGLTFATNGDEGVCIEFHRPVKGIEPFGFLRHPALTVTVADPQTLVDELVQPQRETIPAF
jgi:hypothetical protein